MTRIAFEQLILEIHALDTVGDTCEHLVGDGAEGVAEYGDGQVLAEDLHLITLGAGDIRHVDHRHIHTDITHVLGLLTIHQTIAVTVAEMAVQTVGIADGDGSDHTVALDLALTAVAHRLTSRHMAHLKDGGLQRGDGMENMIIARINAIEADAEAAHIHLALREMLDASGVVHVAQDLMGEDTLQLTAALVEEGELLGREVVEAVAVGAHEMAEHRTRDDGVLMLQTVDKFVYILHRVEAQTVHARIELDMYGPARDTFLTSGLDECVHQTEGIDLGLQVVVEHGLEGRHLRVHDHDIGGDACLTERNTLVGHGHGEIIDTLVL